VSWRSHLREDCETLNARLRQRKIPRGKRAVARRLLSRVFSIESNAAKTLVDNGLAEVIDDGNKNDGDDETTEKKV